MLAHDGERERIMSSQEMGSLPYSLFSKKIFKYPADWQDLFSLYDKN